MNELISNSTNLLILLTIAFTGLVSTKLTDYIKEAPIFNKEEKSKISGLTADVVSALSSLLITLITIGVPYLVGVIDNPDTSTIVMGVISTWVASFGWYKISK